MVYNVNFFGLEFNIKPVAFTLPFGGGWQIYWYGILIAFGFLLALLYGFKTAKRYDINVDRLMDVVLVTTPIAILCARAYYVIFDGEKLSSIGDFFGIGGNSGFAGLAIYGGVIGAFLCGCLMCRIRKVNPLDALDLAATAFLLAQSIGRWGNFFNQEAYGTFTGSSWWGMSSNRTVSELGSGLVHPCFLYESIWCIAGFFLLNYLGKKRKFKGQLVLTYGIWYGFFRGFLELIRTDSLMWGNVRVSSALSFIVCTVCAVILFILLKRQKEVAEGSKYISQFVENEAEENTAQVNAEPAEDLGENNV